MASELIIQDQLPPPAVMSSAEDLMRVAIERGTPVETMERLLAMRRELREEAAKQAFHDALALFQEECPIITKRREVKDKHGKGRYRYAALSDIIVQVKPLLKKHGFSHSVNAVVEVGWVIARCKLSHREGHSEISEFKVPVDKEAYMSAPQLYASALTFAKRYAFCDALGIMTADEDDDAQRVAQAEAAKQPSEADQVQKLKRTIWDKLKGQHPTRAALQQHLWDENLMDPETQLETASAAVLQRILDKLNKTKQ